MKSALVIRNAHGIQKEPPKKRKPGTHTEAFGDTLYAEFDGKKLSKLYVNLNAHGFFYEDDLPDYIEVQLYQNGVPYGDAVRFEVSNMPALTDPVCDKAREQDGAD